ncbi:transposase domain-containing protein [Streptomyces sp. NPDC058466]|uniref:transposase domain-containing protein n=1 Tax=Streptomyces sp. NPDC058466 TaxID=3346512 RepID=UPI00365A0802
MVAVRPGAVGRQGRLRLQSSCRPTRPVSPQAGEGGGSRSSATGSGSACSLRRSLPEVVDEVLELAGSAERRGRLLPARAVVCFVLALFLFSSSDSSGPPGYRVVLRTLAEKLRHLPGGIVQPPARQFGPRQTPPAPGRQAVPGVSGRGADEHCSRSCGSAREARGGRSFPLDPVRVTE